MRDWIIDAGWAIAYYGLAVVHLLAEHLVRQVMTT